MTKPASSVRVMIVDDEKKFADLLGDELERLGFETRVQYDPDSALEAMEADPPDVALVDMKMPGRDGISTLSEIQSRGLPVEAIMLTGHGTMDSAIRAMKQGAYDYLTKPCKLDELAALLDKAAERGRTVRENRSLKRLLGRSPGSDRDFVATSPGMVVLLERITRIASATDVPVLITGESGTGKEWVAREIHRQSPIADEAFVAVNCAALQSNLLESEIFGHEKGAFTGATARKEGIAEVASGGSLFLDEIGEIDDSIQAKLLRFIQFGEFRRVGGTQNLKVDLRIIAATNRDLEKDISESRFREDLYYRLNVAMLHLPPLRERSEDIAALARLFVDRYRSRGDEPIVVTDEALEVLAAHSWPGNVRQLENLVRRLLLFKDGPIIDGDLVRETLVSGPGDTTPTSLMLSDMEKVHILKVLQLCGGNKTQAAKKLGIALKTLYNRLNEYARGDE